MPKDIKNIGKSPMTMNRMDDGKEFTIVPDEVQNFDDATADYLLQYKAQDGNGDWVEFQEV